jgi:hypothetical protein
VDLLEEHPALQLLQVLDAAGAIASCGGGKHLAGLRKSALSDDDPLHHPRNRFWFAAVVSWPAVEEKNYYGAVKYRKLLCKSACFLMFIIRTE